MESRGKEAFPAPEQPETPETPAAIEIIGLKEVLRMIDEGFNNDLEVLDVLQTFLDRPKPDLDDHDAMQEYIESTAFAEQVIQGILPKTERSRDLAQQIRHRIQELEKTS